MHQSRMFLERQQQRVSSKKMKYNNKIYIQCVQFFMYNFSNIIKTCPIGLVKCKNHQYGCSEEIPRNDQSIHEAKCLFAPTKCRYCKRNVHNEKVIVN